MTQQEKRDSIGKEFKERWHYIKKKCHETCWNRMKKAIKKFDKGVRALRKRKKGWTDRDEQSYQESIKELKEKQI